MWQVGLAIEASQLGTSGVRFRGGYFISGGPNDEEETENGVGETGETGGGEGKLKSVTGTPVSQNDTGDGCGRGDGGGDGGGDDEAATVETYEEESDKLIISGSWAFSGSSGSFSGSLPHSSL